MKIRHGTIQGKEVARWKRRAEKRYSIVDEYHYNNGKTEVEQFKNAEIAYTRDGYSCFQLDDGDIIIDRSPYYTLCKPYSEAFEGSAGCLLDEGTVKAYCFEGSWFKGGVAPYKVFDIATGEEVAP